MKRLITCFIFIGTAFAHIDAQTSISNVPDNASLVVKYSGKNFSKRMPVKKLDGYKFVKENLLKALHIDSLSSLEATGIDFEKDVLQYATMEDSSMNFVTMFNLQDVAKFLHLVQANYQAEMRPEKKNGFEFIAMSKTTYLGWNNQQAVMVYSSYKNNNNYYNSYPVDTTAEVAADSAVAEMDAPAAPIAEDAPLTEEIKEEAVKAPKPKKATPYKKKGAKAAPHKKGAPKKVVPKEEPVIKEEEVQDEIAIEGVSEYHMSYEDSVENAKREAWYEEQAKYATAKQGQIAENIINTVFNGSVTSIEIEPSYKKLIDPSSDVSMWINYDNLLNQFMSGLMKGFPVGSSGGKYNIASPRDFKDNENKGFRNGMNLFFEKDKMRLEQNMYSPDAATAALGMEMYNSKQSNSLAGFINPDNIACMSASINTEAMANYYYTLIRQYMSSSPYISDYSDVVDVYMDLIEIIIDEKAIAELMPGNMVMVLHDMKTKTVTYTDYVYDENFQGSEVTKTKQELSPNFTFVMETRKEAFMQKLVKLPVKYAEKGKYDYKDKGGYYELAFDPNKYPINSLYFMVKDGKGIITTSKEVIDMTLNNKGYSLSSETKKGVLNNNVYVKINAQKLIEQITPQLTTDLSKKISSYLAENMGDVTTEGGIKDGMMHGTTIMNITGNHANSLEFFFNMIDSINDMIEKDKIEREKKVD